MRKYDKGITIRTKTKTHVKEGIMGTQIPTIKKETTKTIRPKSKMEIKIKIKIETKGTIQTIIDDTKITPMQCVLTTFTFIGSHICPN
jgi:hypothetical protein